MSRIMTIWLPRWPVQRLLQEQPELRPLPVFICRQNRRGLMTVTSWAWAAPPQAAALKRPDIRSGLSLAEAMAVLAAACGPRACRLAHVANEDRVGDQQSLETVARWCRRFSPLVALGPEAEAGGSDSLQVDVSGTADFFGGETSLARTAVWTLAARGFHARVAIADTPVASWAAARHSEQVRAARPASGQAAVSQTASGQAAVSQTASGQATTEESHGHWLHRRQRWVVVPPGGQRQWLASLPLSALRLPAGTCQALADVGVKSIGRLLRISRASLQQRFEPVVTLQLARLLGEAAEPLVSPSGEELPRASHAFETPVFSGEFSEADFGHLLTDLVAGCLRPLTPAGWGVSSLQMRVAGECHRPTVIDIGLFRPAAEVKHLVDLLLLRLSRTRLPREILAVTVEVVAVAMLTCRQQLLFADEQPAASTEKVSGLLDRLACRLGRGAVVEPRPLADAQPESAWAAVPIAGAVGLRQPRVRSAGLAIGRQGYGRQGYGGQGYGGQGRWGGVGGSRPTCLFPRPQPLEVLAIAPEGPPVRFRWRGQEHRVDRVRGPERIETAWWRGPTLRRDYYIVETDTGGRFWLFRGLRRQSWFLHGTFG